MPLAALLLVLGAAVCHSVWNLLVKSDARRLEIQSGALLVGVVLCSPALLIYPLTAVSPAAWGAVLGSGLFEAGYVFALTAAYGPGDLSLVYPVARGTPPLLVVPLAIVLLGERPAWQGLVGIGLVVLGIAAGHRGFPGGPARVNRRALALALLTGVFTAGYSLVNKLGVALVPVPLYALLVFAVDATLISLARWLRAGTRVRDTPWGRTIVVGVLMMAAYLAVLAAMAQAPVSYVVAAREVSVVVAAILGALVLRERHPAGRIAGAAVIFAGLLVIALAR